MFPYIVEFIMRVSSPVSRSGRHKSGSIPRAPSLTLTNPTFVQISYIPFEKKNLKVPLHITIRSCGALRLPCTSANRNVWRVKPGVHANDFAPIHRRRALKLGHASLATVFRPGRLTFQQIPQENLESPLLKESSNLRHIYRNKCRVYTTYNDTAKKIIRYTGRKLSHFEVEVL